jgi:hypothetical protein
MENVTYPFARAPLSNLLLAEIKISWRDAWQTRRCPSQKGGVRHDSGVGALPETGIIQEGKS